MSPGVVPRHIGFAMCRPKSSPWHLGIAMCVGERRTTQSAMAPTIISTQRGGDIREDGWLQWHPCMPQHPSVPKSNVTDGARWFVASPKGPHHVGMPHARGKVQRSIVRFGDARMASSPVMSQDKHRESTTKDADTLARQRVWERKCLAFSPGATRRIFQRAVARAKVARANGKMSRRQAESST